MEAIQRITVLVLAAFVLPGILNDLTMSPVDWVSSYCGLLHLAIYSVFKIDHFVFVDWLQSFFNKFKQDYLSIVFLANAE